MTVPAFSLLALFSPEGRRQLTAQAARLRWRSKDYAHRCVTTTRVGPDGVDPARYGPHISIAAEGLRLWGFQGEVGRELFIAEHADEVRRPGGHT